MHPSPSSPFPPPSFHSRPRLSLLTQFVFLLCFSSSLYRLHSASKPAIQLDSKSNARPCTSTHYRSQFHAGLCTLQFMESNHATAMHLSRTEVNPTSCWHLLFIGDNKDKRSCNRLALFGHTITEGRKASTQLLLEGSETQLHSRKATLAPFLVLMACLL